MCLSKAFKMLPHYLVTSREWLVVILAIERAVMNCNFRLGVCYFTTLRINIGELIQQVWLAPLIVTSSQASVFCFAYWVRREPIICGPRVSSASPQPICNLSFTAAPCCTSIDPSIAWPRPLTYLWISCFPRP